MHARVWEGPVGVDVHDAVTIGFDHNAVGQLSCVATHDAAGGVEWSLTAIGSHGEVRVESAATDVHYVDAAGHIKPVDLPPQAWLYYPVRPLSELLSIASGASPNGAGAAELGAQAVEPVEAAYRSVSAGCDVPVRRTRQSDTAVATGVSERSRTRSAASRERPRAPGGAPYLPAMAATVESEPSGCWLHSEATSSPVACFPGNVCRSRV